MKDDRVMGFAWYDKESFEALRGRMPDMSESYEDWLLGAKKDLQRAVSEGYRVIRIAVRPQEFFPWCDRKGIGLPGLSARRAYAAEQANLLVKAERAGRGILGLF
ncbi:hypothetical protein [Teichococcus cervicalis]|uniref:Uncharacterized protein n=1 Tax=Pseudoroseomonas cervicalis ATCC 49957 TaxID=525371 RepID=D5RRW1_9PROT|nr:hypothetical protein [Pseudoroseomonas cervicalis]EFH09951.1 hypothetical protein HMPREF0731_3823 [Pseudoroseomonas cervicalis ATCC 49957]